MVYDSNDQWKNAVQKRFFLAIWEIFSYEDNCNNNSYKFSFSFSFNYIFFLTSYKEESNFQDVFGLLARIISVCCFSLFFFFLFIYLFIFFTYSELQSAVKLDRTRKVWYLLLRGFWLLLLKFNFWNETQIET